MLCISPRFYSNPYYDPSPPLWEVVSNSMSSLYQFYNLHKVYIYLSVRSLMPDEPILGGTPGLPVVHWSLEVYKGLTLILFLRQVVHLVSLFYSEWGTPPPLIVGACLCLSIFCWLISVTIGLYEMEKYSVCYKIFCYCTREMNIS